MAEVKDFASQREFKERERTSASSSLISAALFAISLCAFGKMSPAHIMTYICVCVRACVRVCVPFYICILLTTLSRFELRITPSYTPFTSCENVSRQVITLLTCAVFDLKV